MTWHRGLLVCTNEEADAVEAALVSQALACRFIRQRGETAFAFAARNMPELESRNVQFAGIDGGSISLVFAGDPDFQPKALIIRAGYTVGLVLPAGALDELKRASPLQELFRSLGKSSDEAIEDGIATFRWDIDEAPLHAASIGRVSRTLGAIADILDERKIEHRIATFDAGSGGTRGRLEADGDVFIGPDVHVTIQWLDPNGGAPFVTANTGEFSTCGDNLPDAELWQQ